MKQLEFHSQPAELEYIASKVVAKAFAANYDSNGRLQIGVVPLKQEYEKILSALKAGISLKSGKSWDAISSQEIHHFLIDYETLDERVSLLERKELLSDMLAQELKYHEGSGEGSGKKAQAFHDQLSHIVADPKSFEFITNLVWDHHLDALRIAKDEIHELYQRFCDRALALKISNAQLASDPAFKKERQAFVKEYENTFSVKISNVIPFRR